MSIEAVREYFDSLGVSLHIMEFEQSSATVELAAAAVGAPPGRIAKTLAFRQNGGALIVVLAGDAKLDNAKFKAAFGLKAKMLTPGEVFEFTGHEIGGVCPFGVREGVEVYLDESLKRFETVFPAGGSDNSAVELSLNQLFEYANALGWVDVSKGWE